MRGWIRLIFIASAVFGLSGCSQKTEIYFGDESTCENQYVEESDTVTFYEKELQEETDGLGDEVRAGENQNLSGNIQDISNNGGYYVKDDRSVYYWKYRDDSFVNEALFAYYAKQGGEENQLVKREEDGTEKVIYQSSGYGGIFVFQNRFYLTGTITPKDLHGGYVSNIYSVDMEGNDREDYGTGRILDIDVKCGYLICESADDIGEFFLINCENGIRTKIYDPAIYLGMDGEYVYFEDYNELGSLKIVRVGISNNQSDTILYLPDFAQKESMDESSSIISSQMLDGYLYFNYGYLGGTARVYQNGIIGRVGLDGNGYQIIAGPEIPKSEMLYVYVDDSGSIFVDTDTDSGKGMEISLEDMKVQPFEGKKAGLGEVFSENDTAYFYPKADNKRVEIVSGNNLDKALSMGEEYYCIRDVQIAGEYLYYVMEYSLHQPAGDIGWRYQYERQETILNRRLLDGGKPEELYRY